MTPVTTTGLERQVRYRKRDQVPPEAFTPTAVADLYLGALAKVIDAAPSVNVLPPTIAERVIVEKAKSGELTLARAERLIGLCRVMDLGVDVSLYDCATASGRHRDLRRAGVMIDLGADGAAPALDVRDVLIALDALWRAKVGVAA
jgi:hypothetical protein